MKKKLLSIIMVSAVALQVVACGSTDAAKTESPEFETVVETEATETPAVTENVATEVQETAPATENEVAAEPAQESGDQNASYDFEGQYYVGKGNLSITNVGEGNFLIEVWWGSSASEHAEWVMNGRYDDATKTISYSDCVKHEYTLKDNGEVDTDVTAYTNGTGNIQIVDNNTIIWTDDMEHIADDIPMTR